jgi:hypothetical protein
VSPRPDDYLTKIPAEVPAGRVVVHNNVRPTRRLGSRGFRAWLDEPHKRLVVCECGWAPELPVHYRVTRADAQPMHGSTRAPKPPANRDL